MREYVRLQTAILLRRFAFQVNRAARSGDADSIHDLRVAIRRLSRCLRVFAQFYPDRSWKKIRRELADLMERAGAVRDLDITLELLAAAGIPKRAAIVTRLQTERRKAGQELLLEVRRWKRRGFSRKWRTRLDLLPGGLRES
ncbi:MAG TPA: CHAD domain-containing protein [Bryobacteraceae bacterium]|jgi:CHAD domain-containing protein|nr:CHAD domain-containing protein [Bryobacteraceae bacterium]